MEKIKASFPNVDDCFNHYVRIGVFSLQKRTDRWSEKRTDRWNKKELELDSDPTHVRYRIEKRPMDWPGLIYTGYVKKEKTPQRLCKLCNQPVLRRHQKSGFHDKDKCDLDQTKWILES